MGICIALSLTHRAQLFFLICELGSAKPCYKACLPDHGTSWLPSFKVSCLIALSGISVNKETP